MFNRYDIQEAHFLFESYHVTSGNYKARKTTTRQNVSTEVQLNRMGFKASHNLSYSTLSDNGKEIYESLESTYGFSEHGTFDAQNLKHALQYASKAIAKQDNRPVLTCIYLDFSEEGYCNVVGIDGYRIHSAKIRYGGVWSRGNILLPGKDAKTLASSIKKSGAVVEMTYSHTLGKITFKQYYKGKVHARNMQEEQGRYPDYQAIVPRSEEKYAQIFTIETLERINTSFDAFVQIRSDAGNKKLFAQTNPNESAYATTMQLPEDCTLLRYESINVNPCFLYDAILPNEKNTMVFRFTSHQTPIVIREGNVYTNGIEYLAVINPMGM